MKKALTGLALIALAGLIYLFGWSNIFSVSKVTIDLADPKTAQEVQQVLAEPPAAISIGEKLARVDKRAINARLKSLPWIERTSISRNFFSGEVKISISARTPIAKFAGGTNDMTFLGKDLRTFTLSAQAVVSAKSANTSEWRDLPTLTVQSPTLQTLTDVKTLIDQFEGAGLNLLSISVPGPGEFLITIETNGKRVEVMWGSAQDFDTKKRVLDALLAAPENAKVKKIDLSDPINPTVR